MREKIAFLFPGQGSQYVGMGRDIADEYPEAREIFDQMDEVCGKSVSRLCFEGPIEDLTLTVNLQPAITAVNLACLKALEISEVSGEISAGHSLGEYSALTSAGVINETDALKSVQKRGEFMHRESLANPGVMTAVLGMGMDAVADIVSLAGERGVLAVANHNTARQIVITGEQGPMAYAVELVKNQGGKAIPLKVSGAWHCSLMNNAVEDFRRFLNDIPFVRPERTVLFNSTADREDDPEKIRDIMARQLISPVRWYDIILRMLDEGLDSFVEVGPKKVLSGLLKKIIPEDRPLAVYNVEDLKSLHTFLEAVT